MKNKSALVALAARLGVPGRNMARVRMPILNPQLGSGGNRIFSFAMVSLEAQSALALEAPVNPAARGQSA
jgi:hypothetical protein